MIKTFGPQAETQAVSRTYAKAVPEKSSREGSFTKDARGKMQSQHHSAGNKAGGDAGLSHRFTLFEQKLEWAEQNRSFTDADGQGDQRNDVVQVLFDSTRGEAQKVSTVVQDLRGEIEVRIERIVKDVSTRIDAAIRPGPGVGSGPVTISIPLDKADVGMAKIDVTVTHSLVTVKLCLPGPMGAPDTGAQLLTAASELGQLLQAQLPGRRIKITRTTTVDSTQEAHQETSATKSSTWPFVTHQEK